MQSVGFWSLKHDTTKSFGLNRRQYGEILGSWREDLHHKIMNREQFFKGNTSKTVTFDVDEYLCSFVGGLGS